MERKGRKKCCNYIIIPKVFFCKWKRGPFTCRLAINQFPQNILVKKERKAKCALEGKRMIKKTLNLQEPRKQGSQRTSMEFFIHWKHNSIFVAPWHCDCFLFGFRIWGFFLKKKILCWKNSLNVFLLKKNEEKQEEGEKGIENTNL